MCLTLVCWSVNAKTIFTHAHMHMHINTPFFDLQFLLAISIIDPYQNDLYQ